jgi:two-component system nitrate/nitrite response regulator NarL
MKIENPIRIAIVDDHQIVIDGLSSLLKEDKQIDICATAVSGSQMLDLLRHTPVDILLTDVMMPEMNGAMLAKKVKQQWPAIKIIALSMSEQGDVADEMVNDAEIAGYLLKQTGKEELIGAIQKVFRGGQYFQDKILEELQKESERKKQVQVINLTQREIEIVALLEKNLNSKDIADQLFISIRTVETHRKNILKKTGCNNVLSLVKWAYDNKVLQKK